MSDTDQLLKKLQENNLTHWKKAPEGYWNGTGLNKLESCAYYAVLSSLSREELSEILPVVKNWTLSSNIVERIEKTISPEPYNPIKKNVNIDTVLKRFLDKKSGAYLFYDSGENEAAIEILAGLRSNVLAWWEEDVAEDWAEEYYNYYIKEIDALINILGHE